MSGPRLNLHHALFWSLKWEISTAKLFCRASAREDSSPEEENKALSHSPLSQVASWQLVRHPCYTQLKYSFCTGTLSHESLWGGAGAELKAPENLQQALIMGLLGNPKLCPPTLIPTKTTMTTGTGICLWALPYPPCWRKQMSLMFFDYMKILLCNQQGLKGWHAFSDILLYINILARYSISP